MTANIEINYTRGGLQQAVLENHGYVMADAALRRHAPGLISDSAAPFAVPHPAWMEEARVREGLRDSARRTFLGRR